MRANSSWCIGNMKETLNIGCQFHSIAKWWELTDKEIIAMDSKKAITFWRKYKNLLKQIVEVSNED